MATLTLEPALLAYFNELKGHEGRRINKILTHQQFLTFLLVEYQAVQGDVFVLNSIWKKVDLTGVKIPAIVYGYPPGYK